MHLCILKYESISNFRMNDIILKVKKLIFLYPSSLIILYIKSLKMKKTIASLDKLRKHIIPVQNLKVYSILLLLFFVTNVFGQTNLVLNPGFENGSTSWTTYGTGVISTISPYEGSKCGYVGSSQTIDQVVTGLTKNTTYLLTAMFKGDIDSVLVGAKNYNGTASVANYTKSKTWVSTGSIIFITGPTSTSARIFMTAPANCAGFADNFSLTMVPNDTQAPTAPLNLTASNIKQTSFTLSWSPSTDNYAVTSYSIYKNGVFYGTTTSTALNISGLTLGTDYSMTVIAKDATGNLSVTSDALVVTTVGQDPNLNYAPTFGTLVGSIYAGRGQQVLVLPNVTDGDFAKTQHLTLSITSKDTTILKIDSVIYHSPDKVALVYVKDKSLLGSVGLNIRLKDDGGIANGGVDSLVSVQTVNVSSFVNPCANFQQYDTPSYSPRPTQSTIPTVNSYVKICTTNNPVENSGRNFYWAKMWGYIVPTVSDYYVLEGFSNEGFYLYMNLDDGVSTDPGKLTTMVSGTGSTWVSSSIYMQAGKVYYFEAYASQIVSTFPFWIKWTSNSVPLGFISNNNLAPDFDIIKPSTPSNYKVSNLGNKDITLSWDASTDNDVRGIKGYNIYVDGKIVNDTLITGTQYQIKNLAQSSTYSCHVAAVDYSSNSSLPTRVINATTYGADVIAPPVPTHLTSDFVTGLAVKLRWNSVKDGQTQTRGYNVYQNNVMVAQFCTDTTFLVGNLTQSTIYTFTVSAVDAVYNESAKSAPYTVSTVAFDPNETRDNVYKGRLSVKLNPLCKYNGLGVDVGFYRNGMMGNNLVSYGGFESAQMDTTNNIGYFGKSVNGASFKRSSVSPYDGKYSAQISCVGGGYLRCNINSVFDKQNTYLLRFAMKRGAGFTGTVQVKVNGAFGGAETFTAQTVTPTDSWQMYELDMTTAYSGGEASWYLDFVASSPGDIFLDNIQFLDKSCYTAGSQFNTKAMALLKEFKPACVRWGALPANVQNFQYSSGKGSENTLSFADWLEMCNELNCKAFYTTGVQNKTDFMKDQNTFKTFIEYLEGDATTKGGIIRTSEGYGDLFSKSKGILIEMGNEVWGAAAHNAEIGSNYATYGAWCRSAANLMKAQPFYNFDKTRLSYSGRSPGNNYGLHRSMLTGENKELEYLSESGYFGAGLTIDPSIPLATSQLNYHKNSIAGLQSAFNGLTADMKEMLSVCNRILPIYMYEGNMTNASYTGRLGQAITFADYYTSIALYDVPNACIFNMDQGEWRMIDDQISWKKLPLFYVGKYINNYCTGTILESSFTSATKIYDASGTALTLDPVGCKAFTDSTSYSVALFSRDFEHDYMVQLDIPDNVGNGATCKIITLNGSSFTSQDVIVNEQNLTNFKDSILVTVPKFGLTIVRFDGINQHYNAPEVYNPIKQAQSVTITAPNNVFAITANRGHLVLSATVLPTDAFLTTPTWKLLDNATIGAFTVDGTTSTILYATGAITGNGYIRVIAYMQDGSGVSDTVSVFINKQGGVDISGIQDLKASDIQLFPVPATDYLNVLLPVSDLLGQVSIVNLNGAVIHTESIKGREIKLDVSTLKQGVYLIKLDVGTGPKMLKFVKQ